MQDPCASSPTKLCMARGHCRHHIRCTIDQCEGGIVVHVAYRVQGQAATTRARRLGERWRREYNDERSHRHGCCRYDRKMAEGKTHN